MRYIGALDQGTTSTRFLIFDAEAREISRAQKEHRQIFPQPGWVEHDPLEILQNVHEVIDSALESASISATSLAAVGITNQRETTVLWNRRTGLPCYNAIVWQDTRTGRHVAELESKSEWIREKTGLPPSTYFSATKIAWLLQNVPGLLDSCKTGEVLFGTIDSWILWNLTGGPDQGVHTTDISNASRTLLLDLATQKWCRDLLELFVIPESILPSIRPSIDPNFYGITRIKNADVPVCGNLGDQQAALVGQSCFLPGEVKNTYGTGNFLLLNTGTQAVPSRSGLLTTVAYQSYNDPPVYALEGSVAVTGSAVQWLRDQLGIIRNAAEVETLANTVTDNGGVYFVPAFSGLFAPYWRTDARGVIVGLSRFSNAGHIARATLEAICYQTKEVLDAMVNDSQIELHSLKVDGGATVNDTLMQLQADILGIRVVRPRVIETTALGAAYAAGLACGFWKSIDELRSNWKTDRMWEPSWSQDQREDGYRRWKKAIARTFDWITTT